MSGKRNFGGSAGGGKRGPGGGIHYQRNEPAFITKMKQQIGYKEVVPDIDSKRTGVNEGDDDDDDEREDEKPQVVVLKSGDLTAEEAEAEMRTNDEGKIGDKIVFKKPKKDQKRPNEDREERDEKVEKKKKKKSTPNKSLLSFDEDDEEDC